MRTRHVWQSTRRAGIVDLMEQHLRERISIDPNVCFGKPCIKGTRIWVSLLLDFLAAGESADQILRSYPQLGPDDLRAALAYAAEVARERVIPVSVPAAP
jgi:uncharacterized protein (DUF433 family)